MGIDLVVGIVLVDTSLVGIDLVDISLVGIVLVVPSSFSLEASYLVVAIVIRVSLFDHRIICRGHFHM